MHIEVDTHTHTVASGHAFSTLLENVTYAKKAGLKGLVVTDHSPSTLGGPTNLYVRIFHNLPREVEDIKVFYGLEIDILDPKGHLGLDEHYFRCTEYGIASFHGVLAPKMNAVESTEAALVALNNPYIDILGHPGNPAYPVDIECVVKEAARLGKLVEINNHSPMERPGSHDRCMAFLEACKRYEVPIALSSDAHIATNVGRVDNTMKQVQLANFPEELIINASLERFEAYLEKRKERIRAAGLTVQDKSPGA